MQSSICLKGIVRARSPPPTVHNDKQHIIAEIDDVPAQIDHRQLVRGPH